jgi:hypothetical protein
VVRMEHIGPKLYSWVWSNNVTRSQAAQTWTDDRIVGMVHDNTWMAIWLLPGNLRGIPRDCWNAEGMRLGYLNETEETSSLGKNVGVSRQDSSRTA